MHRDKHNRGKFLMRFKVPENAKMDTLMKNGILTVTASQKVFEKPDIKVIVMMGFPFKEDENFG